MNSSRPKLAVGNMRKIGLPFPRGDRRLFTCECQNMALSYVSIMTCGHVGYITKLVCGQRHTAGEFEIDQSIKQPTYHMPGL